MKRYNNIYEEIYNINNLYKAEKKARLGKSKKPEIISFVKNLDNNILKIHCELMSKTYCISEYFHFQIKEPKLRNISKLPYKDRVVQHSLLKQIIPILTKCFISQTYSCIEGRGIHKGLNFLKHYLKDKENTQYVLKIDIKKFYPSINNEKLKLMLRKKFKDKDLLYLLDNIVDSITGLALGNYTSQWLGNYYLNEFDH